MGEKRRRTRHLKNAQNPATGEKSVRRTREEEGARGPVPSLARGGACYSGDRHDALMCGARELLDELQCSAVQVILGDSGMAVQVTVGDSGSRLLRCGDYEEFNGVLTEWTKLELTFGKTIVEHLVSYDMDKDYKNVSWRHHGEPLIGEKNMGIGEEGAGPSIETGDRLTSIHDVLNDVFVQPLTEEGVGPSTEPLSGERHPKEVETFFKLLEEADQDLGPGPRSLGKEINVYMLPLIDELNELNELWEVGTPTYDAYSNQNFTMNAAVLWTISDFSAYRMLSGWSTHGHKACPHCMHDKESIYLPVSRKICYLGHRRFLHDDHRFRRQTTSFNGRRKHRNAPRQWTGSIVMHQGSGLVYNVLKNFDRLVARADFEILNIRHGQHPRKAGNRTFRPPALFTLTREEKAAFCEVLSTIRVPDRYLSNLSRCVQMCSKESEKGFEQLNSRIALTLCQLEKIFPPAFFDVMMHLPVHLADEAAVARSVQYRWMYPIEGYFQTLKRYVGNKGHSEGSITETYLVDECLSFCSMYLRDVKSRRTRRGRNEDGIGHGVSGGYILNNCDEVNPFRRCHANDNLISEDLRWLANYPSRVVTKYKSHISHGFIFRTKSVDDKHKNQNCGVFVPANVPGAIGQVNCYGRVIDIFEVRYCGPTEAGDKGRVVIGSFLLASQALQTFYVENTIEKDWHVVVRTQPRYLFDVLEDNDALDDYAIPNLDDRVLIDNENLHTRVGVEETPFHEVLLLPTQFPDFVNADDDLTEDEME
ncbi:unnamed protein product [Malus baccata var. baccata]